MTGVLCIIGRAVKNIKRKYAYSIILLKQLVKTDFKLRYQGSVLGYLWSLLRPLFLFTILYFVFVEFAKMGKGFDHIGPYLFVGIVLWNYFLEITTGSVSAIVGKGDLIRKINFPKYVIILAGCVSAFINLLLNFVVVAIFMAFDGVTLSWSVLWVPALVVELTVAALGVGFFLSALFVKFRDVGYIWEVITQAAFYATPILYLMQIIPSKAQNFLILNPLAQIIQDVRYNLISKETITIWHLHRGFLLMLPFLLVVATAVLAVVYFRSRSPHFAEGV